MNLFFTSPVLIIEAENGLSRRTWLEEHLREAAEVERAITFYVSCDFATGGPWAGVSTLFSTLLDDIQSRRPDLIERHAFELVYILPELRRSIAIQNPNLTDMSPSSERTRNYPADRAVRNVHGLIDLIDSWKTESCPEILWLIACDSYDEAGTIGGLFFRELIRRRGERLNIRLIAAVERGHADAVRSALHPKIETTLITVPLLPEPTVLMSKDEASQRATELEEKIGNDPISMQSHLAEVLQLWRQAGRKDKLLHYQFIGLESYNTLGLYADALRYSDGLLELAAECKPHDLELRWAIVLKLLMCHIGLGDVETSIKLANEEGLKLVENSAEARDQLYYLLAMFYGRFQKPRDFAKGEHYLELAMAAIEESNMPESERHFRIVFNRNGLAMIRNFQRRPEEAIELCRSGYERLNANLDPDEHRLHRSILLYNIAQVYAATGRYAEAVEYFSSTIAMDPNYSEYYNDRGSAFLQLGNLEKAKEDYLRAIELSPPYFEVFANLGQCYRRMGAMQEAIVSYSRAIDLEPTHLLAVLGRAKAYEESGEGPLALADYTAVVSLDPTLWEAFASRGVIHYEAGDLPASLADFNRAIELKQEAGDLYQNRATVLADLGRYQEAAEDIISALNRNPSEEDELVLKEKLEALLQAAA